MLELTQPERAWRDLYKVVVQIHGSAQAVGEFLPGLAEQTADVNRTLDVALTGFFDALDAVHIGLHYINDSWQPMQPLGWELVSDRPLPLALPAGEAQQLRRLLAWGASLAELPSLPQIGPTVLDLLHGYGREAGLVLATFSAALLATGTPLEPLPSSTLPFERPKLTL